LILALGLFSLAVDYEGAERIEVIERNGRAGDNRHVFVAEEDEERRSGGGGGRRCSGGVLGSVLLLTVEWH
jgi:hypothetical protein